MLDRATRAGSLLGPNAVIAVMWANLGNGLSTIGPIAAVPFARASLLYRANPDAQRGLDTDRKSKPS